ncbi:MAG: (d)CMP kinase [Fimbriimonadaceae bacterium]
MHPRNIVIAIDGPAGAGKSTVAKILASRLGLRYLDTGAMYRCFALKAHRAGLSGFDASAAAALGQSISISFGEGDPQPVYLDLEDVTSAIRTPEIGQLASELSTHLVVRVVLVEQQKAIVAQGGYVLEGRDVTTVVAPNADVKVFLTASIEERARRRWLEMQGRDDRRRLQEVVLDVVARDHRDYTREESPLTLAEDAHLIESFGLTAEEVAERIIALVPAR